MQAEYAFEDLACRPRVRSPIRTTCWSPINVSEEATARASAASTSRLRLNISGTASIANTGIARLQASPETTDSVETRVIAAAFRFPLQRSSRGPRAIERLDDLDVETAGAPDECDTRAHGASARNENPFRHDARFRERRDKGFVDSLTVMEKPCTGAYSRVAIRRYSARHALAGRRDRSFRMAPSRPITMFANRAASSRCFALTRHQQVVLVRIRCVGSDSIHPELPAGMMLRRRQSRATARFENSPKNRLYR